MRLVRKRASIVADVASGVSVALVPLLYHTVGLEFWELLVLVFAGAFLDAPGVTSRQALLPDLAAMAEWRRTGAGYQEIQGTKPQTLGPAIEGTQHIIFTAGCRSGYPELWSPTTYSNCCRLLTIREIGR